MTRRWAFWRDTEEDLSASWATLSEALARKREKEVSVLKKVAERTGDSEVAAVAEQRKDEARVLRSSRESGLITGIFGARRRGGDADE